MLSKFKLLFNAISGAMNDAAGGDISSAVSTLNTAISLIRQSKISSDDACKALIRTLEVCTFWENVWKLIICV